MRHLLQVYFWLPACSHGIFSAHYGEEFRLDCIDAQTDEVVGSALVSTIGILQGQRDEIIKEHGASLFQLFHGPLVEKGKRTMKLPLRQGFKNVFGLDFYVSQRQRALGVKELETEKGTIMWH